MKCVAVTGGSGFVGGRLVQMLALRPDVEIRALVRRGEPSRIEHEERLAVVRGNMADQSVLRQLLRPGCTAVNAAYDSAQDKKANIAAVDALAQACLTHGAARLIHCSTAVVAGRTNNARIVESTACHPRDDYEKTKIAIENLLRAKARGKYELVILRPTAVFGPGGRNLVKMSRDLTHGSRLANYLRSCVNGRRRLHLVHVDNVVAAVEFLIETARPVNQETFIISDDHAAENNFYDVERLLMRVFDIPDYALERFALPPPLLSALLRLRRRSLIRTDSIFASDKLRNLGFTHPIQFAAGIAGFAKWYSNIAETKTSPG